MRAARAHLAPGGQACTQHWARADWTALSRTIVKNRMNIRAIACLKWSQSSSKGPYGDGPGVSRWREIAHSLLSFSAWEVLHRVGVVVKERYVEVLIGCVVWCGNS